MSFAQLQVNQKQWRLAGQRLIEMAIAEFLYRGGSGNLNNTYK